MKETDRIFQQIKKLVLVRDIVISAHGYDELIEDGIFINDILDSIEDSEIVEAYLQAYKGPTLLLLQRDAKQNPIHTVWGIAKGESSPAVLITAYLPDPKKWDKNFTRRL